MLHLEWKVSPNLKKEAAEMLNSDQYSSLGLAQICLFVLWKNVMFRPLRSDLVSQKAVETEILYLC